MIGVSKTYIVNAIFKAIKMFFNQIVPDSIIQAIKEKIILSITNLLISDDLA